MRSDDGAVASAVGCIILLSILGVVLVVGLIAYTVLTLVPALAEALRGL